MPVEGCWIKEVHVPAVHDTDIPRRDWQEPAARLIQRRALTVRPVAAASRARPVRVRLASARVPTRRGRARGRGTAWWVVLILLTLVIVAMWSTAAPVSSDDEPVIETGLDL